LMVAALQNFLSMEAGRFRVFASEGLYRRKAMLEGGPGAHTTWWRGQGGAPPYGLASPWLPSGSPSDSVSGQKK
jgi:hypothetical protein